MIATTTTAKVKENPNTLLKIMVLMGNSLTLIGFFALVFGFTGLVDMNLLSFGLSSGVRVIGTVAIAGCLLSAIGYSFLDFSSNKQFKENYV